MTEKEAPTLLSTETVRHLCKCWSKAKTQRLKPHLKEVYSDNWTRFTCSNCGQTKFQFREKGVV